MAVGNITRGDGFDGAVGYCMDKNGAELIGGNMSGTTRQEITAEFGFSRSLRPNCKKPVWHCSLSLPPSESMTDEQWQNFAEDYMQRMGFDLDNHQYMVVKHSDTEHEHVHIVSSRIGLDGSLWHGRNDVKKMHRTLAKMETEYGLQVTPGRAMDENHTASLSRGEIEKSIRTNEAPAKLVLQQAIDESLEDNPTAPVFIERLEAVGIGVRPSIAKTGRVQGLSFEFEGTSIKGSKLGKKYGFGQLQKRGLDFDQERDLGAMQGALYRSIEDEQNRSSTGVSEQKDKGHPRTDNGAEAATSQQYGSNQGYRANGESSQGSEGSNRRAKPVSSKSGEASAAGDVESLDSRSQQQRAGVGSNHSGVSFLDAEEINISNGSRRGANMERAAGIISQDTPPEEKSRKKYKKTVDYLDEYRKNVFRWKNGKGGDVLCDKGNLIEVYKTTPASCKAAVQMGQRKGWTTIQFEGGDQDFHKEMYLQARLAGYQPENITAELSNKEIQKIETKICGTYCRTDQPGPVIIDAGKSLKINTSDPESCSEAVKQGKRKGWRVHQIVGGDAAYQSQMYKHARLNGIKPQYIKSELPQEQLDRLETAVAQKAEIPSLKTEISELQEGVERRQEIKQELAQDPQHPDHESLQAELKTLPTEGDLYQAEKRLNNHPLVKVEREAAEAQQQEQEQQRRRKNGQGYSGPQM